MPNTLTDVLPIVYAQGVRALREACVLPRLVNRDFAPTPAQPGDAVGIPIPSAITAQDVAPGPYAASTPDIAPTRATVQLSNWKEAVFQLSDSELARVAEGVVPAQVTEAVRAIANAINASIFELYTKIPGHVGTAGTTPFASDLAAAQAARRYLNRQAAPLEDRHVVLDPDAEANAIGLRAFQDASWRADTQGIVEGQIGRKLGFNWFMDQQTPTHTRGTISTLTPRVKTAVSVGATTVTFTSTTLTGTLVAGDVFRVAGDPTHYVVTTGGTAAGNDLAVSFAPAAKRAWAANTDVTIADSHVVNLALHRDAIALVVRPLTDLALVQADSGTMMSELDPVSGLALRLEVRREFKRYRWSFDALWGVAVVRPECAVRIMG